jgi:hypothetical protein
MLDAESTDGVSYRPVGAKSANEGRLPNRNGGPSRAVVTSGLRGPFGSQTRRLSGLRLF